MNLDTILWLIMTGMAGLFGSVFCNHIDKVTEKYAKA